MTATETLADDYLAYRQSTDLLRLMAFGELDHLDAWESVDSASVATRQERLREVARAAASVADTDGPSALLDTIGFTAEAGAAQLTWRTDQTLVNPAFGFHASLVNFLGRFSLTTADHGAAYLDKIRGLPGLLDDIGREVHLAAADGRVALQRHLSATASAAADLAAIDGDHPLARQAPPTELDAAAAERWRATLAALIDDEVRPALARYGAALAEVAPNGRSDDHAGFTHLPGGDEVYASLVRASTTLDTAPEEIHQIGLEQVARLEDEYRAMAGPLVGATDIDGIYRALRDDESMRYQSGADIVRDATAALERAAAVAPDWFHHLPTSDCLANETPAGALAFYSPPDPETGKPGRFFFNTADPAAWATYQLEAVTFHESIPGHHLQLALFVESDELHPVQRRLGIMAYLEGWGLYTERLADEMGLYSSELARVGMLAADSMRACRLVVDTGMHALGWSRQQAVDYMRDHSPLSVGLIGGEVDRYIGMPGQALSYMLGRLEIDRIRAEAEQRPGFDIATFHDQLLANGMVPLATLRRLVLGPSTGSLQP